MPNVSLADAKDQLSRYAAAAASGEDVVITRHGKPYVRLVAIADDRLTRQREAVRGLAALGDELRAQGKGVPFEQIVSWIHEDRK